jgi:protein TonB
VKRELLVVAMVFTMVTGASSSAYAADNRPPDSSPPKSEDRPPVPVSRPDPDYPLAARKAKLQGDVVLDCTLGVNGKLSECKVTKKLSPDCDESALTTVRRWRYKPAIVGGEATAARMTVTVKFKLGKPKRSETLGR